jgi:endonuclease/exonuclease/phosphatase family metal-dependent hydrolase
LQGAYNVHFESPNYGRIQIDQLEETIADIKRYPDGTAFLLTGDLNSKHFLHIFRDKLVVKGFVNAMGNEMKRIHLLFGALNWICARVPIHVSEGTVRHDISCSDHLPVEAMIQWQ